MASLTNIGKLLTDDLYSAKVALTSNSYSGSINVTYSNAAIFKLSLSTLMRIL